MFRRSTTGLSIAGLILLAPAIAAAAALAAGLSALVCAAVAAALALDGIASWTVLARGPYRRPRARGSG